MLIGRVEIADVSLERPTIAIDIAAERPIQLVGPDRNADAQPEAGAAAVAAFSEIRIDHGTVVLHEQARKFRETLDDVEFSLAWPSISKSFGATGRFDLA